MSNSTKSLLIGIAVVLTLLLAWQLSAILLLAFAGLLLAAVLDAIVRPLDSLLPIPRPLLVVAVALVIAGAIAASLSLGGASLWQGIDELWTMVMGQAGELYDEWGDELDNTVSTQQGTSLMRSLLPDPTGLFSQASSLFGITLGVLGNIVIIAFLGLFFAIDPHGYRDGFLRLIPAGGRSRLKAALDAAGDTLRGWLITQLAVMVLIGVLVFTLLTLLGSSNALVLSLLAASLNFIPYLGPIVSAVPILLVLAGQDMTALWIGALGLLVIQNLEGYVITPLLQQGIIKLPPAWSLLVMAVMGALFGPMGVALATPFFAVARTLTQKLYIEPREGSARGESGETQG
ncbi:AI-2E family transporter [Devosia sp. CAU 1758]